MQIITANLWSALCVQPLTVQQLLVLQHHLLVLLHSALSSPVSGAIQPHLCYSVTSIVPPMSTASCHWSCHCNVPPALGSHGKYSAILRKQPLVRATGKCIHYLRWENQLLMAALETPIFCLLINLVIVAL